MLTAVPMVLALIEHSRRVIVSTLGVLYNLERILALVEHSRRVIVSTLGVFHNLERILALVEHLAQRRRRAVGHSRRALVRGWSWRKNIIRRRRRFDIKPAGV